MTKNLNFDISDVSAVCLQFPKLIVKKKIRPFFKSARQADSEYAKILLKSLFFEEILFKKAIKSHATSQLFFAKNLP